MAFIPAQLAKAEQSRVAGYQTPRKAITGQLTRAVGIGGTIAQLIINSRRPSIGPIKWDCTLSEEHGIENDIPGVPVQRNVTENDAIIAKPRRVSMTGVISDMASTFMQQDKTFRNVAARFGFGSLASRENAWARIKALNAAHEPFEIYTHLETYKDMVIMSAKTVQRGESDLVVRIVCQKFEQVNVRIQRYLNDTVLDVANGGDDLGVQGAVDVSELNPDEALRELTTDLQESGNEMMYGIDQITVTT